MGLEHLVIDGVSMATVASLVWRAGRRDTSDSEAKAPLPVSPDFPLPFEFVDCDELPEYPWELRPVGQSLHGNHQKTTWIACPKCQGANCTKLNVYCPERGGHFHRKCKWCRYEWAMRVADWKAPVVT